MRFKKRMWCAAFAVWLFQGQTIALACGQIHGGIEAMDLAAVAEFKHREGQTEVKFLDRVRALQALGELLGGEGGDDTAQAFFQALEDAASVAEKRGSETVD